MECCAGDNQNGGVDGQRKRERDGGIGKRIADRFPLALRCFFVLSRLHDAGVEIQIVRHDGRAEDADGDVEHIAVAEDLGARNEAAQHRGDVGA